MDRINVYSQQQGYMPTDRSVEGNAMEEVYYAHTTENSDKKDWQSVETHLEKTAEKAATFGKKIGMEETAYSIGLLHDIGKYSDEFQERILRGGKRCDHSTAAGQVLKNIRDRKKGCLMRHILMIMQEVAMSHHGGLMDFISIKGTSKFLDRLEPQLKNLDEVNERGKEIICKLEKKLEGPAMEQELKSVQEQFEQPSNLKCRLFYEALRTKFLFSCLIDADRLDTISVTYDFPEEASVEWEELENILNENNESFPDSELNRIRKEIFHTCKEKGLGEKAIYKLAVPTGGGKTLSSLAFAVEHAKQHKLDRIIYVLPYISIIEQNAEVVRDLLIENEINTDILIESHSNFAGEEKAVNSEAEKIVQYKLTDNWSGQIVFTTMVQFLENVFGGGTQGIRRFHNMANAVIIFDEIQSLPTKTIYMFNLLVKFLRRYCGTSIVLSSATQPLLDQLADKRFSLDQGIEIIENEYEILDRVEIVDERVEGGYKNDELIEKIEKQIKEMNSVLFICNTKKVAENLFKKLREKKWKEVNIHYLSTNLCAQHRSNTIKSIKEQLNKKEKVVCISTQLIEAGVDLDFECVFRSLAGLDSIIQAAGRCNREGMLSDKEGNLAKGKTYIVNCAEENLEKLPDIRQGVDATERVLDEIKAKGSKIPNIMEKEGIAQFYRYYFYDRQGEMEYPIYKKDCLVDSNLVELFSANDIDGNEEREKRKEELGSNYAAFETVGKLFRIIQSKQTGIVVPYGEGKEIVGKISSGEYVELRKMQRYTVNVYDNILEKMGKKISTADNGILYISELYYDKQLGLREEGINEIDFDGGIVG